MKTIKKIVATKFFGIFMSALVMFATTYKGNAATLDLGIDKNLSGEQIFRQVFFFQGGNMQQDLPAPIQTKLTALDNLTPEQKNERDDVIDNVVNLIKSNNPSYFTSLKTAIDSQNPYSVRQQIVAGGEMIINALNLQGDLDKLTAHLNGQKIDLSNAAQVDQLVNELQSELGSSKYSNQTKVQAEDGTCFAIVVVVAVALALAAAAAIAVIVCTHKQA